MGAVRKKAIKAHKPPLAVWKLAAIGLALAFGAAILVYGPALTGPFVFDDTVQHYAKAADAAQPLLDWVNGERPMLFFSFWLNHLILGNDPFGYHLVNVIIHVFNAALVFLLIQKLLSFYRPQAEPDKLRLLAGFGAAVFLLHPIQTESVSYIASRSETLCAFFMLSALALFLYRRPGPVTWPTAASIALLCAAACATKEEAVVLAPILVLADLYWETDFSMAGLRDNWRLYVPLVVAGAVAGSAIAGVMEHSKSVGFRLHDISSLDYFFTQCRVFFSYIRLLVLPVGQTLSPDVPLSRNIFEHGTIFGLVGILGLIAAAIYFRRRYRLASFGILLFLILLAPTSSFVPLLDAQVEHRLYLPTMALTLVLLEFLLRARLPDRQLAAACIAVSCVYGAMSYARNQVWGSEVLLWQDALSKAPDTQRPYFGLAIAYLNRNRCNDAAGVLERASARFERNDQVLGLWARAEECLSKYDEAVDLMTKAARITPRAVLYMRIGMIRTRQGKSQDAYDAYERAIELDPTSARAYVLRGEWYEAAARLDAAVSDFRHAVELSPNDGALRERLDKLERLRLGGAPHAATTGQSPAVN
jgi:protein O-mannosyl-transferase